jgi:Kdo2-lipid IVA lauroyltransferase/acyltransferase
MKLFKYFVESIIIYLFFLFIKIVGLKISRKLFSYIFNRIGPLIKSKKVINENIDKLIGSYSEETKTQIKKDMWSNYAKTFVEYIYLKRFKNQDSHIEIKGINILNKIISNNKPVIFVSGHFSNFELMSMELVKKKIKLATIYRPLNNYFLNPFMEYVRRKYVCQNQIKKGLGGVKIAIDYLKKNYSIALMIDQRVSEGKRLPFFDHSALTTTLPAQLATKYNCDIVPISISRKNDDRFYMEVFEPIKILNKDKSETNKVKITIELNKIIEKMIIRDPSQWIWTHNRWK